LSGSRKSNLATSHNLPTPRSCTNLSLQLHECKHTHNDHRLLCVWYCSIATHTDTLYTTITITLPNQYYNVNECGSWKPDWAQILTDENDYDDNDAAIDELTLLVTVGSCRATAIRCPSSVLVRSSRSLTLVALVQSCRACEYEKLLALGRLFTSEITIYTAQHQALITLHSTHSQSPASDTMGDFHFHYNLGFKL